MFINTFTPHGELGGSMPPQATMVQSFKYKTRACGGMKRGNRFTRAECWRHCQSGMLEVVASLYLINNNLKHNDYERENSEVDAKEQYDVQRDCW